MNLRLLFTSLVFTLSVGCASQVGSGDFEDKNADTADEEDTETVEEEEASTGDREPDVEIETADSEISDLIELSSNEISFGTVSQNRSSTKVLTIDNISGQSINGLTLEVSSFTEFSLIESCESIPTDESCDVEIRFSPSRRGNFAGVLAISIENADGFILIDLIGQGQDDFRDEGA